MSVIPVTPGVTRAVLQFTYAGQVCNNVLHFKQAGAGAAPDPVVLGARLAQWWGVTGKNRACFASNLDSIVTTDLSAGGEPSHITIPTQPANGSCTDNMPNNVTLVMSIKTALRGRSYRGRIYHIGICGVNVTDNKVIPAYLSSLLVSYEDLVVLTGGVGEPDFQLGVLSTVSNGTPRTEGLFTPATTITSDGIIDSQRRRLPGRGR